MKFRLTKKTKDGGEAAPERKGLAQRVKEARDELGAGVGREEPPTSADVVAEPEEKAPRTVGMVREGEEVVPEVQEVIPVTEAPQVSITMERQRALPILQTGTVDLDKERKKKGKLPKFQCSTCAIGPDCPEYKEGYVCAYNDAFNAFPVRDTNSVLELMKNIVDTNKARLMRAFLSEELISGGQLDMNVTRQSEVVLNQARNLVDLSRDMDRVTVSVQGDQAAAAGGGILAKLFGGGATEAAAKETLTLNPPDPMSRPSWEPEVVQHTPVAVVEDDEGGQESLDAPPPRPIEEAP